MKRASVYVGIALLTLVALMPSAWAQPVAQYLALWLGTGGSATGSVVYYNASNSNTVTEQAGVTASSYTLKKLTAAPTSGGVLYFSAADQMASSAELTANRIVLGGGAGTAPAVLGSLGTTTTVLHGNAAGAPTYGAVVEGDLGLTDLTTANASTTAHGFLKKLSNVATEYMDGSGNWSTPAGGANTALSNLASVAINTALLPGGTGLDLGAAATAFRDLWLHGSGTYGSTSMRFTGTPTGNRVYTFPNLTMTIAGIDFPNQTWTGAQQYSTSISMLGNNSIRFNGTAAPLCHWNASQTPDSWICEMDAATSRTLQYVAQGNGSGDYAYAVQTNPTLVGRSAVTAATSTTQYWSLTHDQTDALISSGAGAIKLAPAASNLIVTGTAPAITSCGTTPSTAAGSSAAGRFTWGSGGTDATCTLTFATAYATAPACTATNESSVMLLQAAATTTVLTITTADAAGIASDVVTYTCVGGS